MSGSTSIDGSAGDRVGDGTGARVGRGTWLVRGVLGGAGVLLGLYGAYLFWSRQQLSPQRVSAAKYLVGGVVFTDVVVALVLLAVGVVVVRFLPAAVRAPVVVGGVVLGSVTLLAIPVLLAKGRKPDNPTLLDRDFVGGWWVFAAVVVVAVAAWVAARLVASRRRSHA
jgi:hypothetical protein